LSVLLLGVDAQRFPIYGSGPFFLSLFDDQHRVNNYNLSFFLDLNLDKSVTQQSPTANTQTVFLSHPLPVHGHRLQITASHPLFLYHPQILFHPTYLDVAPDAEAELTSGELLKNSFACTVTTKYACAFNHGADIVHLFTPPPTRVPHHVYEQQPSSISFANFTWVPDWNLVEPDHHSYLDESFLKQHTVLFDNSNVGPMRVSLSGVSGDDGMNNWVVFPLLFFIVVFVFFQTKNTNSISNTESICAGADIHYFSNNNNNNNHKPRNKQKNEKPYVFTLKNITHVLALATFFFQLHHPWRAIGFAVNIGVFLFERRLRKSNISTWFSQVSWNLCILDAIWNCVAFAHLRINEFSLLISMFIFYSVCSHCWKLVLSQTSHLITNPPPSSVSMVFFALFVNYWLFFCFENVIPWVDLYIVSLYQLPTPGPFFIYLLVHLVVVTYAAYVQSTFSLFALFVSYLQET
jgi:hypothetical protein